MKYKLVQLFTILSLCTISYGQVDKTAILKQFSSTGNDSLFITKHSSIPYQKFTLKPFHLPHAFSPVDSLIFSHNNKINIIGPLDFGDHLIYIKITAIDSLFRMRVGNIWLSPEKRGEDKIEKLADDILKTVQRTGDFNAMSKEYSDDYNLNYEGDLGWFFQGAMVPEFEKDVLSHKKGEYYIVSTTFGKHVVKTIETPVFDRAKVEYVMLYLNKK